jgi:hypothetical protein
MRLSNACFSKFNLLKQTTLHYIKTTLNVQRYYQDNILLEIVLLI